jgi:hypothetical protein
VVKWNPDGLKSLASIVCDFSPEEIAGVPDDDVKRDAEESAGGEYRYYVSDLPANLMIIFCVFPSY